jgi:hypothetical protein
MDVALVQAGEAITQLQPDWSRPLPQRIVIPTVATLTTLADARVLIEQLPEDHRADACSVTLFFIPAASTASWNRRLS